MSAIPDLLANASPDLPDRLRQHLPRAAVTAAKNAERLEAAHGGEVRKLHIQLHAISRAPMPVTQRLQRLRYVAGQWSSLVSEFGACRKGCNHCCHVPVLVPESEAKAIAKRTGARLANKPPAATLSPALEARIQAYTETPCTFLQEGSCSIYDDRPVACRALVNLDDTDLLCELLPGTPVPVPYANNTYVRGFFTQLTVADRHADIREWFPVGK